MANFITNIASMIQGYFASQQEKKKEALFSEVESTQEEKHITGANNLLMRYQPKGKPKVSNTPIVRKK